MAFGLVSPPLSKDLERFDRFVGILRAREDTSGDNTLDYEFIDGSSEGIELIHTGFVTSLEKMVNQTIFLSKLRTV